MKKDRSNWTVRKVSFAEAEELDIAYWADKNAGGRMKEATEWIEKVWGMYQQMNPEWKSIPEGKHLKNNTDPDDF